PVYVARVAARAEDTAVVVAFDARPDIVGERGRHDQQLVLVGSGNPEITVVIAIAQYAVLDNHNGAVGRVAVRAIGLQREGAIGIAIVVDIDDSVAAGVSQFLGDALGVGRFCFHGCVSVGGIEMTGRPVAGRD